MTVSRVVVCSVPSRRPRTVRAGASHGTRTHRTARIVFEIRAGYTLARDYSSTMGPLHCRQAADYEPGNRARAHRGYPRPRVFVGVRIKRPILCWREAGQCFSTRRNTGPQINGYHRLPVPLTVRNAGKKLPTLRKISGGRLSRIGPPIRIEIFRALSGGPNHFKYFRLAARGKKPPAVLIFGGGSGFTRGQTRPPPKKTQPKLVSIWPRRPPPKGLGSPGANPGPPRLCWIF